MRDNTQHLYNNFELRKLLIPIIVEQLLSSLMGTADTIFLSFRHCLPYLPGARSCAPSISAARTKKMPTVLLGRFCLSWSFCL